MTAPALVLDVTDAPTETVPRQRLPVVDVPGRRTETAARARLAALITAQLWSSIFGRRADLLERTLASAVDAAVRELGRELAR